MGLGVDYNAGDARIYGKYGSYRRRNEGTNPIKDANESELKLKQQEGDTFVSRAIDCITGDVGSGNTCTDGKDDGKIGIGGVVANVAQGVVRTVPNMIKGAVLDSNGNISPLKIAGTIALGAACIAVPALGLGVCAFGVASGAAKTVTNVGNALSAKTDEEAKAAWENVGNGAASTAISYVGMKASYNAMQKSASINPADGTKVKTQMEQLGGKNFLDKLKQNGIVETGKALVEDAKTSTSNNFTKIGQRFSSARNNAKLSSEAKELNKLEQIEPDKLTTEQKARLEELQKNTEVQTKAEQLRNDAQVKAEKSGEHANYRKEYREAKTEFNRVDKELSKAQKQFDKIKPDKSGKLSPADLEKQAELQGKLDILKDKHATAQSNLGCAKTLYRQSTAETSTFGKYTTMAAEAIDKVKASLKANRGNIKPSNLPELAGKLGTEGMTIARKLADANISDESIIAEFGYAKVSQVLAVLAGGSATDSSI